MKRPVENKRIGAPVPVFLVVFTFLTAGRISAWGNLWAKRSAWVRSFDQIK